MKYEFKFEMSEYDFAAICYMIYFLGLTAAITYVYQLYFH